jgi:hypothetical protein
MALVPRIDLSCPLGVDEQRRIAGHCNHCDTPVHALDGMDEAARRALLARAEGPVCVSYRVPARLAQMAAIALTLVTTTAFADEPADAAPASQSTAAGQQDEASPASPARKGERVKQLGSLIVLGAVADPRDAAWVDDSTLPELPVVEEANTPGAAPVASGTN